MKARIVPYTSILHVGAPIIVNPVNCIGKMGAGLALEYRRVYPNCNLAYESYCEQKKLKPGGIFWYSVPEKESLIIPKSTFWTHNSGERCPQWIANAATKDNPRGTSRLEWVVDCLLGLQKFKTMFPNLDMVVPALGCGLGGLSWVDVKHVIEAMDWSGNVMVISPKGEK